MTQTVNDDSGQRSSTAVLIATSLTLFSMFFGAGNLIFPPIMGASAGTNLTPAMIGFLIGGVALPVISIITIALSGTDIRDLVSRAGKPFGFVFSVLVYLSIGAFYALPRTGAVSFSTAVAPVIGTKSVLASVIFNLIFFGIAFYLCWNPTNIIDSLGKVLTPILLGLLVLLVFLCLASLPASHDAPTGEYVHNPLAAGLLEGYMTMDSIAALAFGIIVVNAIRSLGVEEPGEVAKSTIKAGLFSSLLMALIYVLVTMIGAQSRGLFETAANGGEALAQIADHYFGSGGAIILAITVTLACLKTAVGLITSCAQTFVKMFPNGPSYRVWACGFCLLSFLIANLGLNAIVACSMPVLMFLYPLAIALILLTLCGKLFQDDPHVLRWTISLTAIAAALDFLRALPAPLLQTLHLDQLTATLSDLIPLAAQGFGWIPFALAGFLIGMLTRAMRQAHTSA